MWVRQSLNFTHVRATTRAILTPKRKLALLLNILLNKNVDCKTLKLPLLKKSKLKIWTTLKIGKATGNTSYLLCNHMALMSEKNLKGVPTNLSLSITRFACCSHRTQLSTDFFSQPIRYFYFFILFISLILHTSTMPFPFFHWSWLVGHTWCMFAFLLPFTVDWSVSGSDWPALVYALVQVMVSGSGHQVYGFYLSRLWLVTGAIYRSILVSCGVLALVLQASWFIFMYSIMLPWIMSNHPLLHVSVLSLFFVSSIGINCLDQFTVGYNCHLIDYLPI